MNNDNFVPSQGTNGLSDKPSGNPLQMRGLSHVFEAYNKEGVDPAELQFEVCSAIKEALEEQLQNMDKSNVQAVLSFLQGLDNQLVLDYNKEIRQSEGRSR